MPFSCLLFLCDTRLVTRLTFEGKRATGVEIFHQGKVHRIGAGLEVVLSLGAIHTPKVLMQSGIGDETELHRLGIPVLQHLPGVGQNFQDHVAFDCVSLPAVRVRINRHPPQQDGSRSNFDEAVDSKPDKTPVATATKPSMEFHTMVKNSSLRPRRTAAVRLRTRDSAMSLVYNAVGQKPDR